MVHVDGGTYQWGGSPTDAGTRLTLREFWIDRTEVTLAQYARCVKARKCTEPNADWKACNWAERETRGDHPVNCVSWDQASSFCLWMKRRMPSEEQWELAARGTGGRLFPWKDASAAGRICTGAGPCAAGRHELDRSPYGVMDMGANLREWTSSPTVTADQKPARIVRGGGWRTEEGVKVSVLERTFLEVMDSAQDLGFRCSTDIEP